MDKHQAYLDGDSLRSRTITDTTTLPLHPPVRAAEEAVVALLSQDFRVTGEEARKRVRVEITHEVEMELRRLISSTNLHLAHPRGLVGPMQIMGVSYYVVHNLPEPGWRVIA